MRFTPKTEEEIDTRTLLAKGEYSATVVQATDETSKSSGREQIHLLLRVEDAVGNRNTVHDYLLEAMAGKLRHFCVAADLLAEYESGELSAAHCQGQDVRVKLDIEKGENGYQDKNVVRDYLPRSAAPSPARVAAPANGTAGKFAPVVNGAADAARKQAWADFKANWDEVVKAKPDEEPHRNDRWKEIVEQLGITDQAKASAADWKKVSDFVKSISLAPAFDDSDIPF